MKVDEVQTSDSFKDCVSQAVANVTNQIVYGRRLEYNGDMMETLTKFEAFFANSLKAKLIPGYKTLSWVSTCRCKFNQASDTVLDQTTALNCYLMATEVDYIYLMKYNFIDISLESSCHAQRGNLSQICITLFMLRDIK